MGTDCTVTVEKKTSNGWEMICIIPLDRNYRLFDAMQEHGHSGYPTDVTYDTQRYLGELEDWGEGYMSLTKFYKLSKDTKLNCIKKKYREKCRIIYRFDN